MKTFALAGNPNCGKTTLFNALTGATAHVGNWPGVTVDKREGVYKGGDKNIAIVDLPGIYSLSPYTPEEVIARNYILEGKIDGIINIVDATNLERNLYLTTQLLEMDVPVIVALNMMDEVEKAGDKIDEKALEAKLGVPVVAVSALKKGGVKQLMKRAAEIPESRKGTTILRGVMDRQLDFLTAFFEKEGVPSPLFHAIKLLENDEIEIEHSGAKEALTAVEMPEDPEAIIADERYKYITANLSTAKIKSENSQVLTKSDKIDRVLTHRVWAIPIFIAVLFCIFHLTFSEDFLYIGAWAKLAGKPLPGVDELGLSEAGATVVGIFYDGAVFSPGVILYNAFDTIFSLILDALGGVITVDWVSGLVCDGVLGGIFAVLGFLPQILVLFMFFSILEDTGYMARIAFVLDKLFRRFGLSGRAFMPMIMGFGCSIPAMINTRTLADEKERTATIRIIPFFSCGAKLPILTAISGGIVARFGLGNADLITYGMYLLGVCSAIVAVLLMRNTTQRGEIPPFIMELPAYRLPSFKNLMLHLWDKAKHFVKKAFTVIFISTVIIWVLSNLTWDWKFISGQEVNGVTLTMEHSILASIGKFIQPIFTPLGFGSQLKDYGWVFAVAALTGLVAKENVIATFSALAACVVAGFEGTDSGVAETVLMIEATGITIPALISFIAFNMMTVPCFAACATAKAELPKGKFKFTLLFWVCASYLIGSLIYTCGQWWWPIAIWVGVAAVITLFIVLRNTGKFDIVKLFKKKKEGEE